MDGEKPYKVKTASSITAGLLITILSVISLYIYISNPATGHKRIDNLRMFYIVLEFIFLIVGLIILFYGFYCASKVSLDDTEFNGYYRYYWTVGEYTKRAIIMFICGCCSVAVFFFLGELDNSLPEEFYYTNYISPAILSGGYCFIYALTMVAFAFDAPLRKNISIAYNSDFWKSISTSDKGKRKKKRIRDFLDTDSVETSNWNCRLCGKSNAGHLGTCACGARKPSTKAKVESMSQSISDSVDVKSNIQTEKEQKDQFIVEEKNKKFCQFCGKRLLEGTVFCAYCGKKLD